MLPAGLPALLAAAKLRQTHAGKTKLLVAMLHLMVRYMRREGAPEGAPKRVLLAAHTNTAVDRVMAGLMESDCTGQAGCAA